MALTADKKTEWMEGRDIVFKNRVFQKIHAGALVSIIWIPVQQQFCLLPASDTANESVLGIALESKEVAEKSLLVRTTGVVKLKFSGSVNYPPGSDVYIVDDETVSCDATTNNIVAGKLVMLDDDPNYAWVRIG